MALRPQGQPQVQLVEQWLGCEKGALSSAHPPVPKEEVIKFYMSAIKDQEYFDKIRNSARFPSRAGMLASGAAAIAWGLGWGSPEQSFVLGAVSGCAILWNFNAMAALTRQKSKMDQDKAAFRKRIPLKYFIK